MGNISVCSEITRLICIEPVLFDIYSDYTHTHVHMSSHTTKADSIVRPILAFANLTNLKDARIKLNILMANMQVWVHWYVK